MTQVHKQGREEARKEGRKKEVKVEIERERVLKRHRQRERQPVVAKETGFNLVSMSKVSRLHMLCSMANSGCVLLSGSGMLPHSLQCPPSFLYLPQVRDFPSFLSSRLLLL